MDSVSLDWSGESESADVGVGDIPLYGDDGALVQVPAPVPVVCPPEQSCDAAVSDHRHSEGCERCAGKFVYKRKPTRPKKSIPVPPKPSVVRKPPVVKRSYKRRK